jgi:GTPase Era involved in 16S rRNA processing
MFEASKMLNMFVVYCFERKITLPALNENYLHRAIMAITSNYKNTTPRGVSNQTLSSFLNTVYFPWKDKRGFSTCSGTNLQYLLQEEAKNYHTNCVVFLMTEMKRQIRKYCTVFLEQQTSLHQNQYNTVINNVISKFYGYTSNRQQATSPVVLEAPQLLLQKLQSFF